MFCSMSFLFVWSFVSWNANHCLFCHFIGCCDFFKKPSGKPEETDNPESKPLIEGPSSETFGPDAQLPQEPTDSSSSSSSEPPADSVANETNESTSTSSTQSTPPETAPLVTEVPLNIIPAPSSPSSPHPSDITSSYRESSDVSASSLIHATESVGNEWSLGTYTFFKLISSFWGFCG